MDGKIVLVLTRKPDQKIVIGDDIVITVLEIRSDSVRLGIDAPVGVKIQRDEIVAAVMASNISATHAGADSPDIIKDQLGLVLGRQGGQPASDNSPQG
jgi:carbon storage regulator